MTSSAEPSVLQPPARASIVASGEVLRALVSKELHVKYKRSVLGFMWSLVTPLALAGVYLFVFVEVYRVPQHDFGLFVITGLLPWHYFSMSVQAATGSLVENAPLIRKVYFPRALLPTATVVSNLVNFLMGLAVLCVIVGLTGRPFWRGLHWLVLAVVLETCLCLGAGLLLSVWNVWLRDIGQLIGVVLLVLFFSTPIVFDLSFVPDRFRPFVLANPMTSVMELYRAALFDVGGVPAHVIGVGVGWSVAALAIGYGVFRRLSPQLAKEV